MGEALVFGLITFGPVVIFQFIEKVDEIASNYILAAVPLFVFMGTLLEQSGIVNRLFDAIHIWTKTSWRSCNRHNYHVYHICCL